MNTPPELSVNYYAGYTFDAEGIRVWPRRKYKYRWADLASVFSIRSSTAFFFRNQAPFEVSCTPGKSSVEKYLRCLNLALQNAPPDIQVSDHTRFVMEYAAQAGRASELQRVLRTHPNSAEDTLTLARIHWATTRNKKALQVLDAGLKLDPSNLPLLRAKALILMEFPDRRLEAIVNFEDILRRYPEDVASVQALALLLLGNDDANGLALAEQALKMQCEPFELRNAMARFHASQCNYEAATEVLKPLLDTNLTGHMRDAVTSQINEFTTLSTDPKAQRKVLKRRRAAKTKASFGLVLVLLFWIIQFVAGWFLTVEEVKRGLALRQLEIRGICTPGIVYRERNFGSTRNRDQVTYGYSSAPRNRISKPSDMADIEAAEKEERPLETGRWREQPSLQDIRKWIEEHEERQKQIERMGILQTERHMEWHTHNEYVGTDLAKQIQSTRQLQYVRYWEKDPDVSAIGPITNGRIWLSWIRSKGTVVGLFLVLYTPILLIQILSGYRKDRMLKRRSILLRAKKH